MSYDAFAQNKLIMFDGRSAGSRRAGHSRPYRALTNNVIIGWLKSRGMGVPKEVPLRAIPGEVSETIHDVTNRVDNGTTIRLPFCSHHLSTIFANRSPLVAPTFVGLT